MDEQPKYLCELCNVRFNDFAEHVLNDNHAGSDLFSVGCYGLHISTGQFGYYHIRFETTLKDNYLLSPKIFQLVKIDKNLVITRSTYLVYGSKIKK